VRDKIVREMELDHNQVYSSFEQRKWLSAQNYYLKKHGDLRNINRRAESEHPDYDDVEPIEIPDYRLSGAAAALKEAKRDIKETAKDPFGLATTFAEDFLHEKSLDVEHFSATRKNVEREHHDKDMFSVKQMRRVATKFATDEAKETSSSDIDKIESELRKTNSDID